MQIYIIRHGLAIDAGGDTHALTLRDEQRYLTQKGRMGVRQVGRKLKGEGVRFDAILTSPLCRAVQTAELLAEATDFTDVVEVLPALQPGVPPRICAGELPSRGLSVALVGHEPGQSMLGAFLVGRPGFPPLRPGQVSLVEDGQARWFLHPETLQLDRLLLA